MPLLNRFSAISSVWYVNSNVSGLGGEGERFLLTEENKMSRLAEYDIKLKRINAA